MAQRLVHRGPDEQGFYECPKGRFCIGFRRLSIIDPPCSHQPMVSADGTHVLAFNGEIYNFRELRSQLQHQGVTLSTRGDTEVLLHLYRLHGAEMVQHLRGMFAFALYDGQRGSLLLARDRLGEKPLWYAPLEDRIVFASEGKALAAYPGIDRSIRPQALVEYALLGYIPGPKSVFAGVHKLAPASMLSCVDRMESPKAYWVPRRVELPHTPELVREMVRATVEQSVRLRMEADVPLGALLSGGVDSAVVTALMARAAGKTGGVRTFTAGFDDTRFDERAAARRVAEHLGTEHTELLVRPEPRAMLDRVVAMHDEPFADSSTIPTYLVCQAAREHVKVAITGDGGDEMFGGYDRYRAMHLAERMSPPQFLGLQIAAAVVRPFAPIEERSRLRRLVRFVTGLTRPFAQQYLGYRAIFQPDELGRLFTAGFTEQNDLEAAPQWFMDLYEDAEAVDELQDEIQRAQRHDLLTYLPDDLLVKSDICSMAGSLELRAALLDHDLVNLGLSLPAEWKIRGRRGKAILRELFADLLPPQTLAGPKRGFGVPLGDWLRGELAQQMQDVLLDRRFLDRGLVRREAVHGLINDHLSGRDDHRHRLWLLMVLAKWLDQNG